MLWVGFQVGTERYAVRARDVVEVIPRVLLRPVPHAPASVAGLFNFRGQAAPVVDLGILLGSAPTADLYSSRILVVRIQREGLTRPLGLLAEKVTEVSRQSAPAQPGVAVAMAPYLGSVLLEGSQIVQTIEPAHVLTDELWEALFPAGAMP